MLEIVDIQRPIDVLLPHQVIVLPNHLHPLKEAFVILTSLCIRAGIDGWMDVRYRPAGVSLSWMLCHVGVYARYVCMCCGWDSPLALRDCLEALGPDPSVPISPVHEHTYSKPDCRHHPLSVHLHTCIHSTVSRGKTLTYRDHGGTASVHAQDHHSIQGTWLCRIDDKQQHWDRVMMITRVRTGREMSNEGKRLCSATTIAIACIHSPAYLGSSDVAIDGLWWCAWVKER